jgi:hypothetical protein
MSKKALFIILLIIVIAVVGYFVVLKSGKELNEPSPLDPPPPPPPSEKMADKKVKDNLDSMSEEKKKEFRKEVEKMKDKVMEKEEPMPPKVKLAAKGDFMERLHSVAGQALLITEGEKQTVRFENFNTDNGPQLHIYLSADLGSDDFVDLGPIKATKGNVNYDVPKGTDTNKYKNVLVWCKPFGVLFSYAELKSIQ